MTIVCATHFTDTSLAAVKVAAQLARTHREPLWLLNVMPHPDCADGREIDVAISSALALEAARLATEGLVVSTATVFGRLDRAAQQVCSAKKATLLVVGDSNRTLGPLSVGPLDRFADGLGVPSLIVRDAEPFMAWAAGTAPLKVMLAMDGTWKSSAAREWIIRLAAFGPIDLVASYLWWPKDERQRRAWALIAPRLAEQSLSRLPSNVKYRVRLEVAGPQIGAKLLALANSDRADVFVLGTHPHRGPRGQQWSVSHELLALAPMSVACIPDPMPQQQLPPQAPDRGGLRVAS